MKVLDLGVYLGWDRFGIQGIAGCPMDKDRYPLLTQLINKGYANKLMLSQDCAMQRVGRTFTVPKELTELLHNHHPTHVPKRVIPTLKKAGVTKEQINTITRDNPRRLFAG